MTVTAVWPIQVAVATQLATISGLGVHQEGEVSRSDALPYAVLGSATEPGDSRRYSGQPGLDQTLRINFWADTKLNAYAAYASGKVKLDGVILTLTGYGKSVRATLSFVTDFAEPDPEIGGHVVVSELRTRTIEV
jgi:hypothetical protein